MNVLLRDVSLTPLFLKLFLPPSSPRTTFCVVSTPVPKETPSPFLREASSGPPPLPFLSVSFTPSTAPHRPSQTRIRLGRLAKATSSLPADEQAACVTWNLVSDKCHRPPPAKQRPPRFLVPNSRLPPSHSALSSCIDHHCCLLHLSVQASKLLGSFNPSLFRVRLLPTRKASR